MNRAFIFVLIAFCAFAVSTQTVPAGFDLSNYGVQIEPDKRVIVVLATINAGRTNVDGRSDRVVDAKLSPVGAAFRDRLDAELTVPDDLRSKISIFLTQYKKRRPNLAYPQLISPFVAMAYSLAPAPDLTDPSNINDLPGDLLDVLDFAPLVREFYRRSGISSKIDGYVKDYRSASDENLRAGAREMVPELLDYLHTKPQTIYVERVKVEAQKSKRTTLVNTSVREHERRFFIVPELLEPAGNVQFLNIRDDYYVVVPPDTNLAVSDARRAFIQYVVDAIVLTNSKEISSIIPSVKQLIDQRRKTDANISPDPFLAVSRSFVSAIDAKELEYTKVSSATFLARQKIDTLKSDDEKRKVTADLEKFKQAQADETALRLSEDYENGAVLSFYFAQQLNGMEASGFDIAASMRDILLSFDAAKEGDRLTQFADARKRAATAREARKNSPQTVEVAVAENPVTAKLLEIQKTIESKDYAKASDDLNALVKANPNDPRIHYNIGRVSMLRAGLTDDADAQAKLLLEAKNAYADVLRIATSTTDRALISLTYVALARIYEFNDMKPEAIKLYDKAIEIGEVAGGGYRAAIDGKLKLVQNP
jgi:tetratricopeptide (TPR) repeat protein/acylphosphatase